MTVDLFKKKKKRASPLWNSNILLKVCVTHIF